jgi:hypothetical protein
MDLGRGRAPALRLARAALVASVLALAITVIAAPAYAATVSVDGDFLRILSQPGEANALTVADAGGGAPAEQRGGAPAEQPGGALARSFSVIDTAAPLVAGPGCVASDNGVTCVTSEQAAIEVSAGDGDDAVTIAAPVGAFVDGGPGDDLIQIPGGVSDSAWCGPGRDSVVAEVDDFLDLGCERVDYGPAGSVGRIRALSGGGRWVPLPGQTWALVDRRILPDVLYLIRRYHVRITEGYGTVGHEPFGEHPLGLAVDIEPGAGGTWADVSRLARWAEPRQNHPRRPFRWVGWNGDFNHGHPSVCKPRLGCAPHLHLSWSHSPTPPRQLARTVWVFQVRGAAP